MPLTVPPLELPVTMFPNAGDVVAAATTNGNVLTHGGDAGDGVAAAGTQGDVVVAGDMLATSVTQRQCCCPR